MKAKYFLIIFVVLNIIVFSSVAVGKKDYKTEVTEGTDLIWVCNVLDEDSMKDIFEAQDWLERDVPGWDDYGFWENIEQGSKMRWYILDAREESSYTTWDGIDKETLNLKFKLWKWTDDADWDEKPDYKKARAYMYADPKYIGNNLQFLMPYDYGHDVPYYDPKDASWHGTTKSNIFYDKIREFDEIVGNHYSGNFYIDFDYQNDNPTQTYAFYFPSWGLPMWIPQDVDDYLDDMDFYEHRFDVDDKARTIHARIKEQSFDFFDIDASGVDLDNGVAYELPNEDIKWSATYNEQGFMSNFKLWNSDNDLVCEFTLQTFKIPGYDIPIFLSIMCVSVIAVIYVIMKKRK